MSNLRNNLSDEGLMTVHRIFAANSINPKVCDTNRQRFSNISSEISAQLLARIPLSHFWQVEKLQRDLKIPISTDTK